MVAIRPLGAVGIYVTGRDHVDGVFCLLRTSCESGTPVAVVASMSGLSLVRNDEKFLRHVEWALGGSH